MLSLVALGCASISACRFAAGTAEPAVIEVKIVGLSADAHGGESRR